MFERCSLFPERSKTSFQRLANATIFLLLTACLPHHFFRTLENRRIFFFAASKYIADSQLQSPQSIYYVTGRRTWVGFNGKNSITKFNRCVGSKNRRASMTTWHLIFPRAVCKRIARKIHREESDSSMHFIAIRHVSGILTLTTYRENGREIENCYENTINRKKLKPQTHTQLFSHHSLLNDIIYLKESSCLPCSRLIIIYRHKQI